MSARKQLRYRAFDQKQ